MLLPSEKPGFYILVNGGLLSGVATWEGKSTSGKWAVLIPDTLADPNYETGGKYRDDALWKIESPNGKPGNFYSILNSR